MAYWWYLVWLFNIFSVFHDDIKFGTVKCVGNIYWIKSLLFFQRVQGVDIEPFLYNLIPAYFQFSVQLFS